MSLICSKGLLCAELGISEHRDGKVLEDLVTYSQLLERWSQVQRLVGWRKASLLASQGLADAWAMLPVLDIAPEAEIVDLGAGAGLPGLILAIGRKERAIHLVESRRKRVSFLREVVRELGLDQVRVHHGREEELRGTLCEAPPIVLARALAPPDQLLERARGWSAKICVLSLSDSQEWTDEGWTLEQTIPGRPAGRSRHCVLRPIV